VRDGEPCAAGSGYCHSGKCPTHSANCRLLWGPGKCAPHCLVVIFMSPTCSYCVANYYVENPVVVVRSRVV
jgi:hypothetical protein